MFGLTFAELYVSRESDILTPLQLINAQLTIECHIATAFIVYEFSVHGPQDEGGEAALFLPKHREATVTEVYVENLKRRSIYATTIVPKADAGRYSKQGAGNAASYSNIPGKNEPELFSLMFGNLGNGESVSVRLQWFQPLSFEHVSLCVLFEGILFDMFLSKGLALCVIQ